MDTEKSIKLMKVIKEILPEHYNFDFGKPEIDEVIKRLQMWDELYAILANPEWTEINVLLTMKDLEEKYFPKPKTRWQRINDVVCKLTDPSNYINSKELRNLLIELRDEEL